MNKWINLSIDYANQRSYLDDLYHVYPTIPEGIKSIDKNVWVNVERRFKNRDNQLLIGELLKMDMFPIKDSYVEYLRHDITAVERNPRTINRICGRIYEIGLANLYERCCQSKELHRKSGPVFRDWVRRMPLGINPVGIHDFIANNNDAILDDKDEVMLDFAKNNLDYKQNRAFDFIARFNGKYIVGYSSFITSFENKQKKVFDDTMCFLTSLNIAAEKIAILDGVLYINDNNDMYNSITDTYKDFNIMSALVMREFLYHL